MTIALATTLLACGDAAPPPEDASAGKVCAVGAGGYLSGPSGDAKRLCLLGASFDGAPIAFEADVANLEGGTYFWRSQVGGGPVMTGSSPTGYVAGGVPGERATIELLVVAPSGGEARWSGASLKLRGQ